MRQSGFVGTVGRDPSPVSSNARLAPIMPPTLARPVSELPPPIIPHVAAPAPPAPPRKRKPFLYSFYHFN